MTFRSSTRETGREVLGGNVNALLPHSFIKVSRGMYRPTLLLEALLREEKLGKKFAWLLLACDEQRAFACQTPSMARETVAAINMRFRASKLRPTDLFILAAFLKQCPDEIFVENCLFWISECLKVTGNRKNEENALDIIKISLEKSINNEILINPISKNVVPRLLDQLLESQKPTYSAIQCLQILFQYYSEPCKEQWKSLQKYLLNFMDEEDQTLVKYASRCICSVPLIAENSGNQGSSWSNLLSELCVTANSVLHQLYKNIPDIVISSSLGENAEGIQLKPIESDDPILLTQQLARRLVNVLTFIEGMLVESCDYIKEIRTDLVITLAYHGLSISSDMFKNSSTMWHVALISVLPDIQTQLFKLLKSLVSCCKGGLLKFGPLFCKIVIKILKVNFSPPCAGIKQYYSKTREAAYNFLENWILRSKAASCIELFDEELISLLFHDLCQRKYHSSNWVHELFNRRTSDKDHWQEINIKPVSSTCEAALQVLCAIVLTSGSQLTLSVHKKLQGFVVSCLMEVQQSCGPEDIPPPCNVAECRLHMYQLLLVLTLHPHPQWPSPINYALSLFSRGQLDSSSEVIKLCTTALVSIRKMVHLSCLSRHSSVESSHNIFPFNTTNIPNEKKGISQTLSEVSNSIVCKKSQTAFSPRSVKALKRSSPGVDSDTLPKKKCSSEGSVESLNNIKALQSTDQDWIVKRARKKQRMTNPERTRQGKHKAGDFQKTIKKRKQYQVSDELKEDLVKYRSLAYNEQDNPGEISLVDLVSDSEIPDGDKILHSNVSCEELITIEDTESSGSENDVIIDKKMEALPEVMEKGICMIRRKSREITNKVSDKDMRNICNVENDYNVGANEEINDTEKIAKDANKIKEGMIIGKESQSSAALDLEKLCQVQSGKDLLEVNDTIYITEECGAKIHPDISYTDNSIQVLSPDTLETKTVQEAELSAETSSFAALSPSHEVFTVNQLVTDCGVDNSKIITSNTQKLLQGADIEGMSSSQISSISLNSFNDSNLLQEEHNNFVKPHTDLMVLSDLTLQKENAQIIVGEGTTNLRLNQDVSGNIICPSGTSNEAIPPLTMAERNNKITDKFCTRKQDAPAVNSEKAASLDNSKQLQELVFLDVSSLTMGERNVLKTTDESSIREQEAPAMNSGKTTSLDESKQEQVSHEDITIPTVEDRNVLKAIDESPSPKQVVPPNNNGKTDSLDNSKQLQELVFLEVSSLTAKEKNVLKTGNESSTRKKVVPVINNRKTASLEEPEQDLVSQEQRSLPSVEDGNVLKYTDENSVRKQDTSAMYSEKAASFDESKQEPESLLTIENKNVIKTNDEVCTRKQDLSVMDNEKAASLDDLQEPISLNGSPTKEMETHYTVDEAHLLNKSNEVKNSEVESSNKAVEPNDITDTRIKGTRADVKETNIILLDDSVKVIEDESVKSSVILKDVLSESKECTSFHQREGALSGKQNYVEEPQLKEKEQNNS